MITVNDNVSEDNVISMIGYQGLFTDYSEKVSVRFGRQKSFSGRKIVGVRVGRNVFASGLFFLSLSPWGKLFTSDFLICRLGIIKYLFNKGYDED